MKNNKVIIFSVLLLIVVIVSSVFIIKGNKEDKPKESVKKGEELPEKIKQKPGKKTKYKEIKEEEIPKLLTENNQGLPKDTFKFNERAYLSITQSGINKYNDEFTGDKVLWISEKDGQVEYKMLTEGTHLVKVIQTKKGPFLKIGNETFIIFYERISFEKDGYNTQGYVYKVSKSGDLKLVYQIKDAFADIKVTKEKLTIVQKVYKDDRNQYPTILKPHDLQTVEYKNGTWEIVKTEFIKPELK